MTVEPHNLSGAYALDALSDDERLAYERHLAECAECADEVTGFRATSARLGVTAEETVPTHLKQFVMEAIAQTPQDRAPQDRPPQVGTTVAAAASPNRFRRVATRVTLVAAALAVIVSVGWAVTEHNRNDDLEAQQSKISTVLSAPDAQMATQELTDGGSVGLVRSGGLDKAVVVASDLPPLDSEHVYQMWTMSDSTPSPAGTMPRKDGGGPTTQLVSGVADVDAVAITVEPEGGSEKPTTKPIVMLSTA